MKGALGLLFSALIGADGGLPPTPPPVAADAADCCAKADEPECRETWRLSLREAIRTGLDNSEAVRVLSCYPSDIPFGAAPVTQCVCEGQPPVAVCMAVLIGDQEWDGKAPLVIARVDPDANPWRFQAEVMAHVRSVEQQYWALMQQHAQLEASERAVEIAREVVKREQSELEIGRGNVADVAEARQRLEQFRLDLVTKTSDVITTERQLRNILGLSPTDQRRIAPVTAALEAQSEPDWDDCLATMMERQPDIILQREAVQSAEMHALAAIGRELVAGVFGSPESRQEAAEETRDALATVRKQRDFMTQVVHQTTHSLARFFQEIDANYQQYQTAKRLRQAATQRLEAQRAFYEEGRITIDRYLDAVSQYASAIAQEEQFKATYNVAIVALEEAKGTLLAHDNIAMAVPAQTLKAPAGGLHAN